MSSRPRSTRLSESPHFMTLDLLRFSHADVSFIKPECAGNSPEFPFYPSLELPFPFYLSLELPLLFQPLLTSFRVKLSPVIKSVQFFRLIFSSSTAS